MLLTLRNSLRAALAGGDKRKPDLPTVDIHMMPPQSLPGTAGMGRGSRSGNPGRQPIVGNPYQRVGSAITSDRLRPCVAEGIVHSIHLTCSARVPKKWRVPAPGIAHAASPLCAFFVCGHTVGSDQFDCCRYRELQSDLGRRISRTLATVVGGSLDHHASSGNRGCARDCASVRGHDPAGRDERRRLIAAGAFDSEIKCGDLVIVTMKLWGRLLEISASAVS